MSYAEKLYKAIMLDIEFYEAVEANKSLTSQAMMTVALVAIIEGFTKAGITDPVYLAQGALGSILRWVVWAFFIAFVGTRILPEPETNSNTGELLRTLGFAYAPGLLLIFQYVPLINYLPIVLIVYFLQLAAMIVAVRQALDFNSTVRAVGVCIVAFIAMTMAIELLIYFSDFVSGVATNASPIPEPSNPKMGV
tara:strand:- start:594 stop:1175 length:582 start_codon:yes stop_codon:yes gene_type:complete